MEANFRDLPSVDRLISDKRLKSLERIYSRSFFLETVRQALDESRLAIAGGGKAPSFDDLIESIRDRIQSITQPRLIPVINATGVILHTNLGRAPLSHETIEAMKSASIGYVNLEINLYSGARDSRHARIEQLMCLLCGAESAMVVNNNASAVLLALTALTKRKEVVVARGQAVEIGGGFRIPDVMRQSGAKLVEIGTTNCAYLSDYEQAITPRTGALLRVHTSNFKVVGFTQTVPLEELAQLGVRYSLPVLDDLGSGSLLDTARFGLDYEPTVQDSIKAGVSLALFSGDKLLGGPQAGIIVGKKHLVDKLKRHPLARAVRIDKTRLAGLAVTLQHYLRGEAEQKIPVWQMISMSLTEIETRAREIARNFTGLTTVIEGESVVGGGSLPGETLPTRLVAFKIPAGRKDRNTAQRLAAALRDQRPPVIARMEDNSLLLDLRTVLPEEDKSVIMALQNALEAMHIN